MTGKRRVGLGSVVVKQSGGGGAATASKQGGGNKLIGLISTKNRAIDGAMVRSIRTRSDGGQSRHWYFCMNQLGGVGRRWGQAAGPGNRGGVHASSCPGSPGRLPQYAMQLTINRTEWFDDYGKIHTSAVVPAAVVRLLLPPGFSVPAWNANFPASVATAWGKAWEAKDAPTRAALVESIVPRLPRAALSIVQLSSLASTVEKSLSATFGPIAPVLTQLPSLSSGEAALSPARSGGAAAAPPRQLAPFVADFPLANRPAWACDLSVSPSQGGAGPGAILMMFLDVNLEVPRSVYCPATEGGFEVRLVS